MFKNGGMTRRSRDLLVTSIRRPIRALHCLHPVHVTFEGSEKNRKPDAQAPKGAET